MREPPFGAFSDEPGSAWPLCA